MHYGEQFGVRQVSLKKVQWRAYPCKARKAAVYTEEFCEAIVEGYKLYGCRNPKPQPKISLLERDGWDSADNLTEIGADDPEDFGYYFAGSGAQIEDDMQYELFEASADVE